MRAGVDDSGLKGIINDAVCSFACEPPLVVVNTVVASQVLAAAMTSIEWSYVFL